MVAKDHAVSQESFSICKCTNCGFLFTNPRPDEQNIGKYYISDDYISHKDQSSNPVNLVYKIVRKFTIKHKVNWLNKYRKSKGRLLDFGCGTGYFLKAAEENGWESVGLEPNDTAAHIAVKKHGLRILHHTSELESETNFDAITLFHTLEHVHELKPTLKLLTVKLKKKGLLFIAVPNFNSYDSSLYKENWAALDVPRHLYHFTSETIGILANQFQLKIKATEPMVFDSYYVSILSEKYINNNYNIIKSITNGYKSNKIGEKSNNNHSSILFILQKK
jgi:2-polyprenyl-3-methyl-5-hydroxy-6-metoxy-1,4-benzoquinol methylase